MIALFGLASIMFLQQFNHLQEERDYKNNMLETYCKKTKKRVTIGESVKVVYKCGNIEKVKE